MTTAFVLMTALPPTKGHLHLIQFASHVADRLRVVVCTQPDEPYGNQRFWAIQEAVRNLSKTRDNLVIRVNQPLPQDPETPGFWGLWKELQTWYGFKPGDIVVSSEAYGAKLAEIGRGQFIPYDPNRELFYTKATDIREDLKNNWFDLMPTFLPYVQQRVTVFGAESTGKTTLSQALSQVWYGDWLYEWARPYLELVGPDITVDSMNDIWKGQQAAQLHMQDWSTKLFTFQDTDLFSTVGYWEQPHWTKDLGPVPEQLVKDAIAHRSDLYLITQSNIPFEQDPLRYGGDKRESPDDFWIDVAKRYGLNYRIIESGDKAERIDEANSHIEELLMQLQSTLTYDRGGF